MSDLDKISQILDGALGDEVKYDEVGIPATARQMEHFQAGNTQGEDLGVSASAYAGAIEHYSDATAGCDNNMAVGIGDSLKQKFERAMDSEDYTELQRDVLMGWLHNAVSPRPDNVDLFVKVVKGLCTVKGDVNCRRAISDRAKLCKAYEDNDYVMRAVKTIGTQLDIQSSEVLQIVPTNPSVVVSLSSMDERGLRRFLKAVESGANVNLPYQLAMLCNSDIEEVELAKFVQHQDDNFNREDLCTLVAAWSYGVIDKIDFSDLMLAEDLYEEELKRADANTVDILDKCKLRRSTIYEILVAGRTLGVDMVKFAEGAVEVLESSKPSSLFGTANTAVGTGYCAFAYNLRIGINLASNSACVIGDVVKAKGYDTRDFYIDKTLQADGTKRVVRYGEILPHFMWDVYNEVDIKSLI